MHGRIRNLACLHWYTSIVYVPMVIRMSPPSESLEHCMLKTWSRVSLCVSPRHGWYFHFIYWMLSAFQDQSFTFVGNFVTMNQLGNQKRRLTLNSNFYSQQIQTSLPEKGKKKKPNKKPEGIDPCEGKKSSFLTRAMMVIPCVPGKQE